MESSRWETIVKIPLINSCTINQLAVHSFIQYLLTASYVPLHLRENEVSLKNNICKDGNEDWLLLGMVFWGEAIRCAKIRV